MKVKQILRAFLFIKRKTISAKFDTAENRPCARCARMLGWRSWWSESYVNAHTMQCTLIVSYCSSWKSFGISSLKFECKFAHNASCKTRNNYNKPQMTRCTNRKSCSPKIPYSFYKTCFEFSFTMDLVVASRSTWAIFCRSCLYVLSL